MMVRIDKKENISGTASSALLPKATINTVQKVLLYVLSYIFLDKLMPLLYSEKDGATASSRN